MDKLEFCYQLTKWLPKYELGSVIEQLGSKPYIIKQQGTKYAVFTDGKLRDEEEGLIDTPTS